VATKVGETPWAAKTRPEAVLAAFVDVYMTWKHPMQKCSCWGGIGGTGVVRQDVRRNGSYWSRLWLQGASVAFERSQSRSRLRLFTPLTPMSSMQCRSELGLGSIKTALPLAVQGYAFLTHKLQSTKPVSDTVQLVMRHNLSRMRYWSGKGALALFEHKADWEPATDGSIVQDLATALTETRSPSHVVPCQNLSAVGRPVRVL
jgi:hypothetical protein